MQPNQNVPGTARPISSAARVTAKAPEPTFDNGPSVVEEKGGKKTGLVLGLVLCLILAAGGIGFGVWAFMDGNTQKDNLNARIDELRKENITLQEENEGLTQQVEELEAKLNNIEEPIVETKPVDAELVEGIFYIKDESGEVLISDDTIGVTEIVSCDYFSENNILKCAVTAGDESGWVLYDATDGSLTSSFYTAGEDD